MTGQQWRTYALLLQLYVTYRAVNWLLDNLSDSWGYVTSVFVLVWSLVGLIVPVTRDREAKHRVVEPA